MSRKMLINSSYCPDIYTLQALSVKIKCINVGYRTIADEISVRVDELKRKAFALTRDEQKGDIMRRARVLSKRANKRSVRSSARKVKLLNKPLHTLGGDRL